MEVHNPTNDWQIIGRTNGLCNIWLNVPPRSCRDLPAQCHAAAWRPCEGHPPASLQRFPDCEVIPFAIEGEFDDSQGAFWYSRAAFRARIDSQLVAGEVDPISLKLHGYLFEGDGKKGLELFGSVVVTPTRLALSLRANFFSFDAEGAYAEVNAKASDFSGFMVEGLEPTGFQMLLELTPLGFVAGRAAGLDCGTFTLVGFIRPDRLMLVDLATHTVCCGRGGDVRRLTGTWTCGMEQGDFVLLRDAT